MYVPGKGPGLHPSGARGPRLKSLDLPLRVCIYIRTYILTVARTCSCAEPPILSCPVFLRLTPQSPFRRQYYQYSTFCPALPCTATHHTYLLHCTILHCAVPWPACIRRVCCRVPSHYHRPGPHLLSPIHRLHANVIVIVSIVPGPLLPSITDI